MITKHFKKFALSAIIILTASLLSACGGSSPDFAPADQAAFNAKFVGSPATLDYGTDIAVININNNNEFETVGFGIGTYTYIKTGENTAEIAFTYSTGMFAGATCTDTLTFTTEISATYNGVCGVAGATPFYNDSGTFAFDVAPADQTAFNAKFVGQMINTYAPYTILANNKYSSTATEDGITVTIYGDFNYTKISANKASASIDVDNWTINGSTLNELQNELQAQYDKGLISSPDLNAANAELSNANNLLLSITCTYTLTFTSILSGTYNETCSDNTGTYDTESGNFKFSGSN